MVCIKEVSYLNKKDKIYFNHFSDVISLKYKYIIKNIANYL